MNGHRIAYVFVLALVILTGLSGLALTTREAWAGLESAPAPNARAVFYGNYAWWPVAFAAPALVGPDLTLTKTHTGTFFQDEVQEYRILVTNVGTTRGNGTVTVTDALPAGLTAISMAGASWTCNVNTLTCTRSSAPSANQSAEPITLKVQVSRMAPSSVTNVATVSYGPDVNTSNNTASDVTSITPCLSNAVVTSGANDGPGSLRQAFPGTCSGGTITFAGNVLTVTLSEPLFLRKSVVIAGPGPNGLTISGNNATGIFYVEAGNYDITFSDLTIADGKTADVPSLFSKIPAGGITTRSLGTVTVLNSVITRNTNPIDQFGTSGQIAGIYVDRDSTLNIVNSTVSDNVSQREGGAIANYGTLNITNSTISGNQAAAGAGIVTGNNGALTISGSTVSGNVANGESFGGAGILVASGTVNITNTTISSNTSYRAGGGIETNGGTTNISSSTIFGNTVAGTLQASQVNEIRGVVNVQNSIIAGGNSRSDIEGSETSEDRIVSGGHNLIGKVYSTNSFLNGVKSDQVGRTGTANPPIDPMLGPLQNNGGPTFTRAPLVGSRAIDKGKSFGLTIDQRGFSRPANDPAIAPAAGGDDSDIGAFELNGTMPVSGSIAGVVTYGTVSTGQAPRFVPGVVLTAAGSIPVNATTNSVGAYSLTGLGAGPYTVTPAKPGEMNGISGLDAARVAQHVAGLITLTPNQQIAGDSTNNGSLSGLDAARIAQTVAGLSNTGITGQWRFLPASRSYPGVSGSQTNQNYEAILVGDVTGNWAPPQAMSAGGDELELGSDPALRKASPKPERGPYVADDPSGVEVALPASAVAVGGTELTIPISVGDTTGRGIVAYEFTIAFDPDVMRSANLPIETAGSLSDGWTVVCNTRTPGEITVIAFGTDGLGGEGALLNMRFDVLGPAGGITELKFTALQLNEGEVRTKVFNRQFMISDAPARPVGMLF